ncbi:MAG: hypothetical protein ACRC33_00495 [Gemmataceae bacterium]
MEAPFRWWFLPSWLGLDAPCVVTTWTWAISRSTGLPLSVRPAAAMFLVVWSIYLSDRLIDVARCRDWERATGRLRFGRRFRPLFVACLAGCTAGIAGLLWLGLPGKVVERAALVAAGVAAHFALFVVPVATREKLPGKEFGVGLFFGLGAFACLGATVAAVRLFAAVAVLVAYNCLVIAARDADSDRANDPGGASRWWKTMGPDLLRAGAALSAASALWAAFADEKAFFLAVGVAFAALTALLSIAERLSGDAVRALADFALFTPLPVWGVIALARG